MGRDLFLDVKIESAHHIRVYVTLDKALDRPQRQPIFDDHRSGTHYG